MSEHYTCPGCGTEMNQFSADVGLLAKIVTLHCPSCGFQIKKRYYEKIMDIGKHGRTEISKEQTKKAVVLSKNEVIGICKSGTSKGKKLVCQFKNGVDTQLFSADDILRWMNNDKYIYGKTWSCWSDTPSLQQEKETPWEAMWETDGSTSKPPLGCAPSYVYISARICELCEAIKQHSTETGKHNQIALWCKEIMYLNEMGRNLRYDEKCKVWKEDKHGNLQEMP